MPAVTPRHRRPASFVAAACAATAAVALASAVVSPAGAGAESRRSSTTRGPQVAVSSCFSSDNGFPELTALSVAPATVDVRRRDAWLTVTARPVDDGGPGPATGITELGIGFTGELG